MELCGKRLPGNEGERKRRRRKKDENDDGGDEGDGEDDDEEEDEVEGRMGELGLKGDAAAEVSIGVQSCVKTFLPSFENHSQNVTLPIPKLHYSAIL